MFGNFDILVDLQTGAITVALPADEHGYRVEIETVTPDGPFAPQE